MVAIPGDCSITGLGLTITDRQKLISQVNIVFHVAATVRFDENLKLSYSINVNGTADVIELCKQMKNLKVKLRIFHPMTNFTILGVSPCINCIFKLSLKRNRREILRLSC